MLQYRYDAIGDVKPTSQAIKDLMEALQDGEAKALHIGTVEELNEKRERLSKEDDSEIIDDLRKRVEALEIRHRGFLSLPSREEIEKYGEL
jgi:hypothetical protein